MGFGIPRMFESASVLHGLAKNPSAMSTDAPDALLVNRKAWPTSRTGRMQYDHRVPSCRRVIFVIPVRLAGVNEHLVQVRHSQETKLFPLLLQRLGHWEHFGRNKECEALGLIQQGQVDLNSVTW